MKRLIFIFAIGLLLSSCKKDKIDPDTAPPFASCAFTQTNTSFGSLNFAQANNDELYVVQLNSTDDVNGLILDFNCDGIGDLRIDGSSDQDWFGQTSTSESKLILTPLNQNTYLLKGSKIDSSFHLSTADTNGTNIIDYQLQSTYAANGSTFTSSSTGYYCAFEDSASLLYANDSRWISSPQVVRDHYKSFTSFYFGPDANGYNHDISDVIERKKGIVPNSQVSWIPIKYINSEGNVKLGYLKLRPSLSFGFISVGMTGWAIQR